MATIVRRKRGVLGWIFLIIFLGFNAFMILWLVSVWHVAAESGGDQTANAVGGFLAGTVILWIWLFGAIITGLLAFMTRSGKTVITER
jgi:hypothetical protein